MEGGDRQGKKRIKGIGGKGEEWRRMERMEKAVSITFQSFSWNFHLLPLTCFSQSSQFPPSVFPGLAAWPPLSPVHLKR